MYVHLQYDDQKNHDINLLMSVKNRTETVNKRMTNLLQYIFLEININRPIG